MTAKEMYIQVTNDLQGIGAQRSRRYVPEQVELELNREIESFVYSVLKENGKGFYSIDEQYFDGVQTLIREAWLPVYTDGVSTFYADLNFNYSRLLDVGARGLLACRAMTGADYTTKTITYAIGKLPISNLTVKDYFKSLTLAINGTTIYTRTTGGYTTNDVNLIITELLNNVPNLFWENANDYAKPGHLILRSDAFASASLTYDGVTVNFTVGKASAVNQINSGTVMPNVIPVRRIQQQSITDTKATAYYKPSKIELPAVVQSGKINLLTPKNLIVSGIYVNYIRRPRKMSLSLDIGCDLDPNIHPLICDRTVQRIRERIGDPKFQTGMIQENKS